MEILRKPNAVCVGGGGHSASSSLSKPCPNSEHASRAAGKCFINQHNALFASPERSFCWRGEEGERRGTSAQKAGDTSPGENLQQLLEAGEKQAREAGGRENKCRVA